MRYFVNVCLQKYKCIWIPTIDNEVKIQFTGNYSRGDVESFFEEVGFSVCIYDCFIMNVFYIYLYAYNKVFK